jgi:hypothetical protein
MLESFFNQSVPMLYFGQVIKFPYGMPAYKALQDKSLAFTMQQCDDLLYDAVHDMDFTGKRVEAHQQHSKTRQCEWGTQDRVFA